LLVPQSPATSAAEVGIGTVWAPRLPATWGPSKALLIAELNKAFAYCDGAYDALADDNGAMMMKFGKGERTMSGILNFNVAHDFEHYGNLITYLRIKGFVPPSSEK